MDDRREKEVVRQAFATTLSGLEEDPFLARRVMHAAQGKEGTPMLNRFTNRRPSRLIILVLAAVLVFATTALAAGVITWQWKPEDMLHATGEMQQAYQYTDLIDSPGLSASAGNVTIALEQSIVDGSAASFAFRVKGCRLPADRQPAFAAVSCSLEGSPAPLQTSSRFFSGPGGADSASWMDENGDLIFIVSLFTGDHKFLDGAALPGRIMNITLKNLCTLAPDGTQQTLAEGEWSFRWPLRGEDLYWDFRGLNLYVGKTRARVSRIHLSPIHIQLELEVGITLSEYAARGGDEALLPRFCGLTLKDGTRFVMEEPVGASGYATADPDERTWQSIVLLDRIIELPQVDCLLFRCPTAEGGSEIIEVPFNRL